jgi:hypothetical protein
MSLSIINPATLKDIGINVDSNYKYENDELFNPNDVKWIFYGCPYEYIILNNGSIETKYGFEHSWGYIESISNPNIKYDILYGMLINRIDFDSDFDFDFDYDSDSESDSNIDSDNYKSKNNINKKYKIKKKKINILKGIKRTDNFEKCEIFVDELNHMEFEPYYDSSKIKYLFIGNPINKFHDHGFNYADGILILIDNTKVKFKLKDGNVTILND